MPRSRSLFASLPQDLRRSIRTRPLVAHDQVADNAPGADSNTLLGNGPYLPTQPASPDSSRQTEVSVSIERMSVQAGSSKRPAALSESSSPVSPAFKKRKGKSKAGTDHTDHPWDCTGLVPRYKDYSDVPSNIKKYFAQRHLYFPLYDTIPLLLDDIGWYSVTPQPIAAHIADRCQSDVIIDAFCGVGGNAIEFARTCERVIAIDNDPIRLRLARHNALHCGVADRIEFILADFTEWAHRRIERNLTEPQASTVDVIFLSPPWGGPEYLSYGKTYPLSAVEPIPGDQLFEIAHKITPNLAYFLPKNVDLKELAGLAQTLDAPSQDGSQGQERQREWVEIEEEWVGDKLKAVTAYFGGLVAE